MSTDAMDERFIEALRRAPGGRSGNGALRETLNWPEEKYRKVQGSLLAQKKIVSGRGRGGTVALVTPDEIPVILNENNPLDQKERDFIAALRKFDGRSGNGSLRKSLDWSESEYWEIQESLILKEKILPGRGKGGSVSLVATANEIAAENNSRANPNVEKGQSIPPRRSTERGLYNPIVNEIREKWVKTRGYDSFVCEETHSQGSRNTGGTFTRPDITIMGLKRYRYILKREIEVITFEIKPSDQISVLGVLEAISHRETAHRSFAIYHASQEQFEESTEGERIKNLAEKHGIGLILAEEPNDYETWEFLVAAKHEEPDPEKLDQFIGQVRDKDNIDRILRWK